ncbi:hypothetical protein B0H17DRAFT_417394 [Mycena rosella]|uniref:Uncharacterized protein n=1 Tax=Mycena rosella TaxID=1033263 RepID=A0AAD7DPF8_MYCRO|nr:hypothetical protein B0H17DRAFT_417394 [Mycena rosella]
MTTHAPHSLPSFAQAFSGEPPLGSISSGNNSLPPIHTRSPPSLSRRAKSPQGQPRSRHPSEEDRIAGRKRSRTEITSTARDDEPSDSDRDSPRLVRIKEEQDQDMLDDSPQQRIILDQTGAPPPSSVQPSAAKKRRVTVSGAPQLNTDVRASAESSSTPISPVVMGFTIMRDNPSAIEQVRSMITVKQKQKALIEQRRGSVVGSPCIPSGPPPSLALADERAAAAKAPANARQRRSPNSTNNTRRAANGAQARPPSPPPPAPVVQPPPVASQNALPPPPISFARRRAEHLGGKRKPADIIISPREAHTHEQFQPAIQSAPPIPQGGGQSSFYSGRFPMTLPRLPSVMGGGDNVRRVPGHVPPTPTRLSMQRNNSSTTAIPSLSHPGASTGAVGGRSPPAASVAIASTLVPPTPMSLHHPGYSGDKSAFLAPFEVFYDALNDSKQMKNWLGEQLQRSNTLIQSLTQQQEKLNETVDALVERKLGSMRAEMAGLHRKVDELEDALRLATGRRQSVDSGNLKAKGKQPLRNGNLVASETYTFPPRPQPDRPRGESSQRRPSPGWAQDRDPQNTVESENGSPAPFDARRLSLSATRLDPPRVQQAFDAPAQRSSFNNHNIHSPPQGFRENPHPHSSPSAHGKMNNSHPLERPTPHRQSSHAQMPPAASAERSSSPQHDSRRNSVSMSSAGAPDEG